MTFKPLQMLYAGDVPKAGGEELIAYRNDVRALRNNVYLFAGIFVLFLGCMLVFPLPDVLAFIYGCAATAAGIKGAADFTTLSRRNVYRALPDGATIATAQLENATAKAVRVWDTDASDWNRRASDWNARLEHWTRLQRSPGEEDFEWDAEGIDMRGRSLVHERESLTLERQELLRARQELEAQLEELASALPIPDPVED